MERFLKGIRGWPWERTETWAVPVALPVEWGKIIGDKDSAGSMEAGGRGWVKHIGRSGP
jgi:hypothetical protein